MLHLIQEFLYIFQKTKVLDKPIHIVSCLSLDGISTISRNVIIVEENTKATQLYKNLYAPKKCQSNRHILELLNTSVGCKQPILDGTTLQMMDQNTINFSTRKSHLAQDSKDELVSWLVWLYVV